MRPNKLRIPLTELRAGDVQLTSEGAIWRRFAVVREATEHECALGSVDPPAIYVEFDQARGRNDFDDLDNVAWDNNRRTPVWGSLGVRITVLREYVIREEEL